MCTVTTLRLLELNQCSHCFEMARVLGLDFGGETLRIRKDPKMSLTAIAIPVYGLNISTRL